MDIKMYLKSIKINHLVSEASLEIKKLKYYYLKISLSSIRNDIKIKYKDMVDALAVSLSAHYTDLKNKNIDKIVFFELERDETDYLGRMVKSINKMWAGITKELKIEDDFTISVDDSQITKKLGPSNTAAMGLYTLGVDKLDGLDSFKNILEGFAALNAKEQHEMDKNINSSIKELQKKAYLEDIASFYNRTDNGLDELSYKIIIKLKEKVHDWKENIDNFEKNTMIRIELIHPYKIIYNHNEDSYTFLFMINKDSSDLTVLFEMNLFEKESKYNQVAFTLKIDHEILKYEITEKRKSSNPVDDYKNFIRRLGISEIISDISEIDRKIEMNKKNNANKMDSTIKRINSILD